MPNILRYPGSKKKLLPALDAHLRPLLEHAETFHDVFVGSASVLLWAAREFPDLKLFANDLDRGVSDILRVIVGPIEDLEALEKMIMTTVPTVALREQIKRREPVGIVESAWSTIVLNRCSFSGVMTAGVLGGRDQKGATRVDSRWRPEKVVRALREARQVLHGRLEVSTLSAVTYVFAMAEEDPSAVFYVDPPYYGVTSLYREIMTTGDHERLAAVLRQRSPEFVLSYDLCPEVERLYSWASIHEVETCYTTAKTNGAPKRARRTEVVVVPSRVSRSTAPVVGSSSPQDGRP